MLEERRRELVRDRNAKIRDPRAKNLTSTMCSTGKTSDLDIEEEIGFALIRLKSETLDRINAASDPFPLRHEYSHAIRVP
jgi:hypothetical protein